MPFARYRAHTPKKLNPDQTGQGEFMDTKTKIEAKNYFAELYEINVNDNVEKKEIKDKRTGKITSLSYLSWPFAIAEIKKRDPQANWEFLEPITYPDQTMMVHCNFTCFGITHYMWLPVMDFRNQALPNPNAFEINKTMMRCLVKAIAVHGLGLYIYAGEDLPEEDKQEAIAQQIAQNIEANKQALEADYKKALEAIKNAKSREELAYPYSYFEKTEYAEKITNACKAKCDLEGWARQ